METGIPLRERWNPHALGLGDSREARKIRVALGIFKQLEAESKTRLVEEREFLSALRNIGFDPATREVLDFLRNVGQIYEVRPFQYRSIV